MTVAARVRSSRAIVTWAMGLVCALSIRAELCGADTPAKGFKREGLDPRWEAVLEEFRQPVPGLLKQHKVPGAALALVDDRGIIWAEGFGVTAAKGKTPVTPDTPFLLGGMSKLVTATAVMLAVQDGLVDLDRPITNYLSDFKVWSRYQEHPEEHITLRRLLNNTAGLPVEAPLGNYFEPSSAVSFEDHVRSIYGQWLVFPVGQAFQCSNASSDLAAYIVQVAAGKSFEQYMKEKVFVPLGMSRSTVDRTLVLNMKDRAGGHMIGIAKMPAVFPALGGAGVYSTARDLARFLQMQISQGMLDGRRILDASLVKLLHTPTGIVQPPDVYYGLGLFIDKRSPERVSSILWQDGWGFGFSGLMHWYPEYGIGTVALSNRLPNPAMSDLALSLTDRLIKEKLVARCFPSFNPDTNHCVGAWWGWPEHKPAPYRPEWRKYCGLYRLRFSAYELEWWAKLAVLIKGRDEYTPQIKVQQKDGFLCLTESTFFDLFGIGRHIDQRLQEIKPGLFSTASGIVLDLTSEVPTWRSYRLEGVKQRAGAEAKVQP